MIRGRRLAAGYFDDRWVVPPRSKGPLAPETVKPQFLQGDLQSKVRWELPARAPTRVGITSPDLKSPLVSSLSMQEGDDTRVWVGIASDAREAAQIAYVDAVRVDDGCTPFAPGTDRVLAPVANFLHNLDSELRRCGLVIHSEVFEASGAFVLDHSVPPLHWVNDMGACAKNAALHTDFAIPAGTIWSIAKDEFLRVWRGKCSFLVALKNFLIRVGAKTGIAFFCKKSGVIFASWAWGATAALVLGPIAYFAGLLIGTRVGNELTRIAFETKQKALIAHQKRMEVVIDGHCRQARAGLRSALQDYFRACDRSAKSTRERASAALALGRARENSVLQAFFTSAESILKEIQRKQRRVESQLRPCFSATWVERLRNSKNTPLPADNLCDQFHKARCRLQRGLDCLGEPDLARRLGLFMTWLSEVDVKSKPLTRAVAILQNSLTLIEAERLTVVKRFEEEEAYWPVQHVGQFERSCAIINAILRQRIDSEIRRAEELINAVEEAGRQIGVSVDIRRPWMLSGIATT